MPIKQLAIEQIVNGDDILRAIENWEGMCPMANLRRVAGVVLRRINIDREQLPSVLRPPFLQPRKIIQVFLVTRPGPRPEIQNHTLTPTARHSYHMLPQPP